MNTCLFCGADTRNPKYCDRNHANLHKVATQDQRPGWKRKSQPTPEQLERGVKTCKRCSLEQPLEVFWERKGTVIGANCRKCRSVMRMAKEPQYLAKRCKRYGVSFEEHQNMVADQDGKCAICGNERTLVIDHDHVTGKVRGLLCHKCNTGLGFMEDNATSLQNAAKYVVAHS